MSEKTLGEEIQELTTKWIDMPTLERMYTKHTELTASNDLKVASEGCSSKSEPKLREVPETLFSSKSEPKLREVPEILFSRLEKLNEKPKIGDKTTIKLDGLGEFIATVHKVTDDKIMLIFDDCVAKRPMNESGANNGGFEASDLNKWLHTEFIKALPYSIRTRLTDVTIPTVGEMFDWDDEWDRNHFEADNDKQLPLMKQRRNRVAYYDNECEFGWLCNATKKEFSSARFAGVADDGDTNYYYASHSGGVRPEIWLTK